MHRTKCFIIICALAALALPAFAQDTDADSRRDNPVEAATEALGLTEEQIEQIRDIRRERRPRGQDREEARTWSEEQRSKIQAVLTDDQRAKVAELDEAREKMRTLAGAAILGLTDRQGGFRGFAPDSRGGRGFRDRGRQGDQRSRGRQGSKRSRDRRSWNDRGTGRGPRPPQGWRGRGRG